MGKNSMNVKVDALLKNAGKWRREFQALRKIALGCGLAEAVKWGQPCYMSGEGNIVLIHGFKEYCALLFFKGALLKDPEKILIRQTKNVQAGRQIRFTDAQGIAGMEPTLRAYIREAVEIEKAGLKVKLKETSAFDMPREFQDGLDENSALKKAFGALTPGRQRAYLLYFSGARQSETRAARVEKYRRRILEGRGLRD